MKALILKEKGRLSLREPPCVRPMGRRVGRALTRRGRRGRQMRGCRSGCEGRSVGANDFSAKNQAMTEGVEPEFSEEIRRLISCAAGMRDQPAFSSLAGHGTCPRKPCSVRRNLCRIDRRI